MYYSNRLSKFLIVLLLLTINLLYALHAHETFKKKFDFKNVSIVAWTTNQDEIKQFPFLLYLKEAFSKKGITVTFQNTNYVPQNELHLIIWTTFQLFYAEHTKNSFVFGIESPLTLTRERVQFNQPYFNKVFTHNQTLTDDKNIFFIAIPYSFDNMDLSLFNKPFEEREVFAMQIASTGLEYNKNIYYLRHDIFNWFLKNHPDEFIQYGSGWEQFRTEENAIEQNAFNKIYKGYVADKIKAFSNAKFAFTYENTHSAGYITEKIFDAMKAGTVPIYLGAPDIEKYVPANCFINAADFNTLDELYTHLKNITPEQYATYQQNIRLFIEQFHTTPFYYKNSADKIINHMLNEKEKLSQDFNLSTLLHPNKAEKSLIRNLIRAEQQ